MKKTLFSFLISAVLAVPAPAQTFGPEGQAVDAAAWCTRMKWDWSWDAVSGIGIARGPQGEWRFRDGGRFAVRSGRLLKLPLAAYQENGRFMVPSSVLPQPALPEPKTAAPAKPAVIVPARQLERVVLDPGHGGHDTGAISPYGTREKDLVLEMALAVRDELVRRGVDVRLTRDSDVFIPLEERAKIANDWKADLFVSIHANAAQARTLRGFEIYTLSEDTDDLVLARERSGGSTLDAILGDMRGRENRRQSVKVAEHVSGRVDDYAAVEARRLKHANFRVLRNTECPAVLVEIGYLTNRRDHTRLSSPKYRRSMVDGIAGGIWTFKREFEATDGFSR